LLSLNHLTTPSAMAAPSFQKIFLVPYLRLPQ
jgi:hypothetical protein